MQICDAHMVWFHEFGGEKLQSDCEQQMSRKEVEGERTLQLQVYMYMEYMNWVESGEARGKIGGSDKYKWNEP